MNSWLRQKIGIFFASSRIEKKEQATNAAKPVIKSMNKLKED